MEIALYSQEAHLPHREQARKPMEMFDPARHGKLRFVRDSWLWSILMGLHSVNLRAMAHLSAFSRTKGRLEFPERVHLEITELTTLVDARRIPITVVDGKPLVNYLWDRQIWSRSSPGVTPFGRVGHVTANDRDTPEFWRDYIVTNLRFAKAEAAAKLEAVREELTYAEACWEPFSKIDL